MIVTCMVWVMINVEGINYASKAQAEGTVLKSNKENYLVDFSKPAKDNEWIGDYSRMLIKKEECI